MADSTFDAFARGFFRPQGIAYLDGAATSLMHAGVYRALGDYYASACANPHTDAHEPGRTSTALMEQSRARLASLVGMPSTHCLLFVGQGATGALNRAARAIDRMDLQGKDVAIVSGAEHHANLLPWSLRKRIVMIPMRSDGSFNMELYRQALVENAGRIAIVAVTWVSNVTGAVLPVEAITAMAKQAGAVTVVDAAQAVPHLPLQMTPDMDFVAFSGHKLYSPGSPGVLIGPCSAFQGLPVGDVGGGAVESVNSGGTHWKTRVEEREEAGTPNVPGVVSLGTMATMLQRVGMGAVRRHDEAATEALLTRLHAVPQCIVYGSDRPGGVSRAGVVSFNLAHVPHAVVARILDERGVAVRNACFCAHPYVRRTLSEQPLPESSLREEFPDRPGMVRASVGPWTTVEDLDKLAAALTWVSAHPAEAAALYRVAQDVQCFDLDTAAEEALR